MSVTAEVATCDNLSATAGVVLSSCPELAPDPADQLVRSREALVLKVCSEPDSPIDLERFAERSAVTNFKPILDVTVAMCVLLFAAPLMLLIALLIRLDSPGPIFFRQMRTGYLGRRFELFKFRTMVRDAEALKASLRDQNMFGDTSPDFKIADDPRITRLGRFLRKTSLDELPNFINVLLGDMSIVGPRPTSFAMETYQPHHYYRLFVKPGITGLWQVSGRADVNFDQRVELDVQYINSRSIKTDLVIILKTFSQVLKAKGAY